MNRALIRSATKPGTVTIKVTADGLTAATLTVVTKPFAVQNGLATVLPSQGLPGRQESPA